ncbi:O-antigen ligase family protein [Pelagibacterium montanilacus]|uniref:O-antigen ligase family protein n=1 Tax=Pelagibacterium montanilacus TaxID=2185280 RepID=UPI0013DF3FA1|nr:O-antigen ligase family protein [Pelagibacterium montanilacus]
MIEALASTVLVSGLVFPGIASHVAMYLTLVCLALALGGTGRAVLGSPVLRAMAAGAGVLVVSILLNGGPADNWLPLVMVLPLIGVASGAAILGATPVSLFATLCLLGVVAGFSVGAYEVLVAGESRAGFGNNPIQYASLMVVLGFGALAGAISKRGAMRFVYVLGPICAFGAVVLSGSRGPIIAGAAMMLPALFAVRRDRAMLAALLALPLAGAIALVATGYGDRVLAAITGELTSGMQESNSVRTRMYTAAWLLFLDSPLWGHGLADMMALARAVADVPEGLENLHSDFANFVAAGGLLGLVAYGLMICAPVFALVDRAVRADPVSVYLALSIPMGHLALGLTMTTLGVLTRTTLFVVVCAFLVARALELVRARGEAGR